MSQNDQEDIDPTPEPDEEPAEPWATEEVESEGGDDS